MTERRASESTDTADHRDDLDYRALARQRRPARPAPGPHRHHRARRRGQLPQARQRVRRQHDRQRGVPRLGSGKPALGGGTRASGVSCGAAAGGRIGARFGDRRFAHLRAANSVTAALLVAAAVLAAIAGQPPSSWQRYVLVAAMALAMGVQNAMARSLAVPDLTTSVLTLTLPGVAADSTGGVGSGGHIGRRLISVCAMLGGALVGALLVIHVDIALPLAIAAALLVTPGARAAGAPVGWHLGTERHRGLRRHHPEAEALFQVELDGVRVVRQVADRDVLARVERKSPPRRLTTAPSTPGAHTSGPPAISRRCSSSG